MRVSYGRELRSIYLSGCLRQLPQFSYAPAIYPLRNVNISGRIKAGIVWMQEFSGDPLVAGTAAQLLIVFHDLRAPLGIFAQMDNDMVVVVEQRHARTEV